MTVGVMRIVLISVVATTIGIAALHAEDGKLKRAREEVRPPPRSQPSPSPSPSSTTYPSSSTVRGNYSSNDDDWSWLGFFFGVSDGPLRAAPSGGGYHSSRSHGLLAYPYAENRRGWLVDESESVPATITPDEAKVINAKRPRLFGTGGTVRGEWSDCGDGLERYAVAAQVSFTYLRLDTEWQRYIEHLPGGGTDSLTLGSIGAAINIAADDTVTVIAGLGLSTFHDRYGNESGWYGKLGVDLFPIRPLIISVEIHGGWIRADEFDSETFLGGGRATAGLIWNRFEAYGGWQATWIESVTLDGPVAGLRLWF